MQYFGSTLRLSTTYRYPPTAWPYRQLSLSLWQVCPQRDPVQQMMITANREVLENSRKFSWRQREKMTWLYLKRVELLQEISFPWNLQGKSVQIPVAFSYHSHSTETPKTMTYYTHREQEWPYHELWGDREQRREARDYLKKEWKDKSSDPQSVPDTLKKVRREKDLILKWWWTNRYGRTGETIINDDFGRYLKQEYCDSKKLDCKNNRGWCARLWS